MVRADGVCVRAAISFQPGSSPRYYFKERDDPCILGRERAGSRASREVESLCLVGVVPRFVTRCRCPPLVR